MPVLPRQRPAALVPRILAARVPLRPATASEQERFLKVIPLLEGEISKTAKEEASGHPGWTAAIQSVLASNEFIYLN